MNKDEESRRPQPDNGGGESPARESKDGSSSNDCVESSAINITNIDRRSLLVETEKIEQSFAGEDHVVEPKDGGRSNIPLHEALSFSDRGGPMSSHTTSRSSLLDVSKGRQGSTLSVHWGDTTTPDAENDSESSSTKHPSSSSLTVSSFSSPLRREPSIILKVSSSGTRRTVQGKESETLLPPTTGAELDAVYFHGKVEDAVTVIQATFRRRGAVHESMKQEVDRIRDKNPSTTIGMPSSSLSSSEGSGSNSSAGVNIPTEEEDQEDEDKEPVDGSQFLYMLAFVAVFGVVFFLCKQITKFIDRFMSEDPVGGAVAAGGAPPVPP
jgi:hypothetical protein